MENVVKNYSSGEDTIHALNGVNLHVKPGEFIMVMGPSGSGKTTLLNVIAGLSKTTDGHVFLNDKILQNLSDNEKAEVRRVELGFIFQFYNLHDGLSAIENIELPMMIARKYKTKERRNRSKDLIKVVNMSHRSMNYPYELSGGEKQRIGIARALANDPPLIIADEPTGDLDSKIALEILELLIKLNKEQKKTLIVVTHDHTLLREGMRLLKMDDGKIIDDLIVTGETIDNMLTEVQDKLIEYEIEGPVIDSEISEDYILEEELSEETRDPSDPELIDYLTRQMPINEYVEILLEQLEAKTEDEINPPYEESEELLSSSAIDDQMNDFSLKETPMEIIPQEQDESELKIQKSESDSDVFEKQELVDETVTTSDLKPITSEDNLEDVVPDRDLEETQEYTIGDNKEPLEVLLEDKANIEPNLIQNGSETHSEKFIDKKEPITQISNETTLESEIDLKLADIDEIGNDIVEDLVSSEEKPIQENILEESVQIKVRNFYLVWKETGLEYVITQPDRSQPYLLFIPELKVVKIYVPRTTSRIKRLNVKRRLDSIIRTGLLSPQGIRLGRDYKIEEI
jgi:putative ABC transport system ATP-binding protein